MQNTCLNRSPAETDATADIAGKPAAPKPVAADQGATVEVVLSAATSFGCVNPGEIVRCEDAADAAQLVQAGIARPSDKQPSRTMPSTAALLAKEAAARSASGEDVTVLQGFDPDVHDTNVATAKAQREQEEKASKTVDRKRDRKLR